ncbi:MAG: isoprenoid biosynthesis glyoxalase ElbB [Oligoflexia bacterium]|nr:isoprenoid biosynthesis glyoxalase ElbB [Oligoflexia bacterium]
MKVAVVLCGSGFKDGSEIRESVGVLWALSHHPVEVQCFAPDAPQEEVVNCLTGQTMSGETRNMLVEAARIARGQVRPLTELRPEDFDAIILPGGFGAAKNLCSFASEGSRATVRPELAAILRGMYAARKPIGAVCIAPAIVALALKGEKLELTVGTRCETSEELEKLGHRHIERRAHECHVDEAHRVVTTPAYMQDRAPLHEIFTGIRALVDEVVRLGRAPSA